MGWFLEKIKSWLHPSHLTKIGKMRTIVLNVPDNMAQLIEEWAKHIPDMEVVKNKRSLGQRLDDADLRMKFVFKKLKTDGVLQHLYDYTWIMMAINQGLIEGLDTFRSPQAFIDYLSALGIDKLPTRFSISLAFSKTLDTYPDWTFIDVTDACEILRRKNVVKQFLSAYGVAKRGIFNGFFNK